MFIERDSRARNARVSDQCTTGYFDFPLRQRIDACEGLRKFPEEGHCLSRAEATAAAATTTTTRETGRFLVTTVLTTNANKRIPDCVTICRSALAARENPKSACRTCDEPENLCVILSPTPISRINVILQRRHGRQVRAKPACVYAKLASATLVANEKEMSSNEDARNIARARGRQVSRKK